METKTLAAAADAADESPPEASESGVNRTLIGGVLAGIGASICCVGPLLLLSLGVSGAWIGNLSAMNAYRPYFILLTLVFLALAFHRLYLKPRSCAIDAPCADDGLLRRQRIIFWLVSLFLLALITFQYYGLWLLS